MRVHHPVLAAVILVALAGHASAQTAGGTSGPAGSGIGATPGPQSVFPPLARGNITAPTSSFTTGTSVIVPSISVPNIPQVNGVPNTSTPGLIGTGALPSGLPGDDPANPGFPAPLNQQQ